jgi:type II secretory pathway pseudopilin PulG
MSRKRNCNGGYTIVESLIFLAVTSSLFIGAASLIGGQQARTEFSQSIRDIESRIRDVANDVSTGYYANTNSFSCNDNAVPGVKPNIIPAGSNNQGGNVGCIFLGRALHLGPHPTEGNKYFVYTVAGKQHVNTVNGQREVATITEASPTAIPFALNAHETGFLSGSVKIKWARYIDSASTANISAIVFLSTFGSYQGSVLQSGSSQVNVFPVVGNINETPDVAINKIGLINNASPVNPDGGIEICIESNNAKESVILTLGGNNRQLTTNTNFKDSVC